MSITINMGIPQLIVICLVSYHLLINITKHGESAEVQYNAYTSFVSVCIYLWILIEGGFFK